MLCITSPTWSSSSLSLSLLLPPSSSLYLHTPLISCNMSVWGHGLLCATMHKGQASQTLAEPVWMSQIYIRPLNWWGGQEPGGNAKWVVWSCLCDLSRTQVPLLYSTVCKYQQSSIVLSPKHTLDHIFVSCFGWSTLFDLGMCPFIHILTTVFKYTRPCNPLQWALW